MKKNKKNNKKNNNKKIIPILLVLFIIGLTIGYAVLTEQLTINNTVSYDAMKWDVGFTAAEAFSDDFEEYLSKQSNVSENIPKSRNTINKQTRYRIIINREL